MFQAYWAKMHYICSTFSYIYLQKIYCNSVEFCLTWDSKRFDCKEGAEYFLLSLLGISIAFLVSLLKLLIRTLSVVVLWVQAVPTEYQLSLTVSKSAVWECFSHSLLELNWWPSDRRYVTHPPELLTLFGHLWLNLFLWNMSWYSPFFIDLHKCNGFRLMKMWNNPSGSCVTVYMKV